MKLYVTNKIFSISYYNFIIILLLLLIYNYKVKEFSFLEIISYFKIKGLYFKGEGGMSNIILGYYSCVYLSIMMKRFFKMSYIIKLRKYYKMPYRFFTNISSNKFDRIYENKLTTQFVLMENKSYIFISTCHDLLELIVPLCRINIAKCVNIDLRRKNYIHEIYKLRKKLIEELLIPKRILLNTYNNFRKLNLGFVIGVHIRTSIYSDFKERDLRFFNNETERIYYNAIDYALKKYKRKRIILYIISDSSNIKYKFKKRYKYIIHKSINNKSDFINHNLNDLSIIEQYILSTCNIIVGSCASTFTLLSVFRYLQEYYAIEGVKYSNRGMIKGRCGYELDYNHYLFRRHSFI